MVSLVLLIFKLLVIKEILTVIEIVRLERIDYNSINVEEGNYHEKVSSCSVTYFDVVE